MYNGTQRNKMDKHHIPNERKTRWKHIAMEWIDYKTYLRYDPSKLGNRLSQNEQDIPTKFVREAMKNWKQEMIVGENLKQR